VVCRCAGVVRFEVVCVTWQGRLVLENSACRVWSLGRTRNRVTLKLSLNFPDLSLEAWGEGAII